MADFLQDLFIENISLALNKKKKAGKARQTTQDPQMAPLISFLQRLFEDADDDMGGTVDKREFRRVFNQPQYKAEIGRLGVTLNEVDLLFVRLDRSGTGLLRQEDIIDGFVKLKVAMRGIDKAISYVKKVFSEADKDGSGTLDYDEFHNLFEQPVVLRKLESLGISLDDIEDLFILVEKEEGLANELTVNQIIESLVRARDPANAGLRGLRILENYFDEADADGSGELSKQEVMDTFNSAVVVDKLHAAKLQVPDWCTLFEELDVDGSDELSWEEIEEGMKMYWAKQCPL
jgi:hypothetical protein